MVPSFTGVLYCRSGGGRRSDTSGKKDGGEMGWNKESSLLDPSSRGFVYDEVDDFEDERDRLSLSRAQALMARPKSKVGLLYFLYLCSYHLVHNEI